MIKTTKIFLVISLFSFQVSAQILAKKEAKILLSELANYYSGDGYELSFQKEIYESLEISEPMESTKGRFVLGKDHQYRLEEKGTFIIQNKTINLVIDSNANEIFVNNVDLEFMPLEIGNLLNDSIYEFYSFQLNKGEVTNQLTIWSNFDPSSTIQYNFNPRTYQISSFRYVFPEANYFSESMEDETLETPVIVVTYAPKMKVKISDDLFSVSRWFSSMKTPLELNSNESRFTLYDLRPQSH